MVGGMPISRYSRPIPPEEQKIYDHLLYWVEWESPSELIERFRALFINGVGYPDPEIVQALHQVIASPVASEDFRFVLNRCCHILINRWQARAQSQMAIPKLIALFDAPPPTRTTSVLHSRSIHRLHQLRKQFKETEQYLTLRRLAQVLTEEAVANAGHRPLGTLIRRYPYLYEHCLLSEDSTQEQAHTIKEIRSTMQRQFELDLSRYVTYQVRRSQLMARGMSSDSQMIRSSGTNPTLLNDRELGQALRHYVGRIDGTRSHKDVAQSFLTHIDPSPKFAAFKDDLYQYITAAIDPEYGKRKFNHQLHHHLKNTLSDSDSQPLNDFLLVRTCNSLLNFLVADQPQHPNHFVFIDLTTNVGPILTTGLLLRIVLLCRKVKPSLERRFSILFNHYEGYTRETVQWLVQALENLNVALTTNFGSVNLSFLR